MSGSEVSRMEARVLAGQRRGHPWGRLCRPQPRRAASHTEEGQLNRKKGGKQADLN